LKSKTKLLLSALSENIKQSGGAIGAQPPPPPWAMVKSMKVEYDSYSIYEFQGF